MSVTTQALPVQADGRGRASWAVLFASVVVLLLAVLLVYSGLLVRLTNDHEGRAILPPTIGGGQTATGELKLTNRGLLPVNVYLEPRTGSGLQDTDLPSGINVSIKRLDDGSYLYQGPLKANMGPLEVINPGQTTSVEVSIRSTDVHSSATTPVAFTYFWAGRPALPWWWWIPITLVILAFVGAGYRRARQGGV